MIGTQTTVPGAAIPAAPSRLGHYHFMNSAPFTGSDLHTFDKISQHPISHNLTWHEVRSLFATPGGVEELPNGTVKIMRNGHTLVVRPSGPKEMVAADQILEIRHFLARSEKVAPEAGLAEAHWLVVINHHEARVFRTELLGAVPQQILPHEPSVYFRHAHNSKQFSRGQEKPEPNSFFAPVAKALAGAGEILICGSGTGTGSEMEQFVAWLAVHQPDLAKRVVGSLVIDEHHLTDAQLLAKARTFYQSLPAPQPR
jgi:hypothetical protein